MSEGVTNDSHGDVLVIKAAGQRHALPLVDLVEITRPGVVTRVPLSPSELLGITNYRGTAVPVVSVSALLGGDVASPSAAARVVILRRKSLVGLMVDDVVDLAKSSDASLIDIDGLLAKNFRFQAQSDRKFETKLRTSDSLGEETEPSLAYLSFLLAQQEFAIAIDQVVGIALLPPAIARLPRTDQAMLGAAEIDGALMPLVSLRFLLGFPPVEPDRKSARVVLTRLGEAQVGVVVDEVEEILRISPDALDTVPPVLTRAKGEAQIEAICRIDGGRRLVSILSPTKFFDADTVARILAEANPGSMSMSGSEENAGALEHFVVFQLGSESYGLPINAVDEVVRCPDKLTRVPIAPAFVRGLMNLRGRAIPVVDQRERFSAEGLSERERRRIVVVTVDGLKTGFLVDKVSEVIGVCAGEVSPAPELATDATGVIDRVAMIERNGNMILLVDPKALLDRAERDVLAAMSDNAEALHAS